MLIIPPAIPGECIAFAKAMMALAKKHNIDHIAVKCQPQSASPDEVGFSSSTVEITYRAGEPNRIKPDRLMIALASQQTVQLINTD